jgi:hypothetical protein
LRPKSFGGEEPRFYRGGDAACNLILHGKDVAELAIIPFGPVMPAGRRIDKLGADAQAIAGPPHAAFQDVAYAKLLRDLLHVDRPALVDEGRVPGDDEQPVNARETRYQVLGNSVGDVLLVGAAAQIDERHDRDRRPVGQRKPHRLLAGRNVRRGRKRSDGRSSDATPAADSLSQTSPTKRMPLRGSVLIKRCRSPLSPMARRAALLEPRDLCDAGGGGCRPDIAGGRGRGQGMAFPARREGP